MKCITLGCRANERSALGESREASFNEVIDCATTHDRQPLWSIGTQPVQQRCSLKDFHGRPFFPLAYVIVPRPALGDEFAGVVLGARARWARVKSLRRRKGTHPQESH